MPESYPYIISNNKIEPVLARIRTAAKPPRFSRETLATWGFTASNDRAMLAVLKELGFLTENGTPTEFYDRLRDPSDWKYVLAERMRDLYSDLFAMDTSINTAPEEEIRGAISRITGKDDESVRRYFSTFRTLASLAKFDPRPVRSAGSESAEPQVPEFEAAKLRQEAPPPQPESKRRSDFHYNIQIHLPATTDISVYNAIFRSLRENLGV